MTTLTSTRTAAFLASVSVFFSVCIGAWILSRPERTFHDQGGLTITFIYFPSTFCIWFLCALLPLAFSCYKLNYSPPGDVSRIKKLHRATVGLVISGFFLSIGTLFLR